MYKTLFLAVLVLAGCNGVPEEIPGYKQLVIISYDHEFSKHVFHGADDNGTTEEDAVRYGIRMWNELGANLHTPDEYPDVEPTYHIKRDTFSWPGESDPPTGITWPGLGYSTIYPHGMRGSDYCEGCMMIVVAHEVGHAIGLVHTKNEGVMHSSPILSSAALTWSDVDEYLSHHPEALKPQL